MTGLVAVALLLPGCSGPSRSGPAAHPLVQDHQTTASPAPPSSGDELFEFGGYASALRQVDPVGLRPIAGRVVRLGDHAVAGFADVADYLTSPGGERIALSGVNSGRLSVVQMSALRVVDRFRVVTGTRLTRPEVSLVSWPRRHMVVGYAQHYGAHRAYPSTVLIIDPIRHTVRKTKLHATIVATAAAEPRTTLLIAPVRRVGPARLVVIGASGQMRFVALPGVEAGFGPGSDWDNEDLEPALLATRRFAYVASAADVVTVVNLPTLAVTEHQIVGDPGPKPLGKAMSPGSGGVMWNSGSSFVAAGHHRLLYVTDDVRPARAGNQFMQRPVALLDTRTWTVRRLFPHVFDAWHDHGLIYLATGRGFDADMGDELEAIDRSGRVVFRRHGHALRWDHSAGVLVERGLSGAHAVQLDPKTGRVIARIAEERYPFDLVRWDPPQPALG